MQSLDISRMSDEELRTYLRGILKGEAVLNVVHDDVPSTRVLSLHQSQVDVRQKDRITAAISTILAEDFIGEVQVRLDARDDEFLADLAFLCESLKITESYRLLRALLDRGTHVPGENFFYQKNTERIILRALVVSAPLFAHRHHMEDILEFRRRFFLGRSILRHQEIQPATRNLPIA